MNQGQFRLDALSFWLGFLIASLLAYLAFRFRKNWPAIKKFIQDRTELFKERKQSGVDSILRQDTLRRSQSSHLAAQLFALDEIEVDPYLLAPPPQLTADQEYHPRKYYPQVFSYLPDAPDFAAHYGAVRLSLTQVLDHGAKIAIVGPPGSGKSTALAYLATRIAKREHIPETLTDLFPLYIHISDVRFGDERSPDPIEELVGAAQYLSPKGSTKQCGEFIWKTIDKNALILLLDGFDELSPPEFDSAYSFLASLIRKIPGLRLMMAASPAQSARLVEADIEPVALSGWNRKEIHDFVQRWTEAWNAHFGADVESQTKVKKVDPLILSSMLCNDPLFHTPMEWTMKAWAACAGNLRGSSSRATIDAHVNRRLDAETIRFASALAAHMLSKRSSTISYTAAEKIADGQFTSAESSDSSVSGETKQPSSATSSQPANTSMKRSSKTDLSVLEANGFITRHITGQLGFSTPVFNGYFASRIDDGSRSGKIDLDWSAQQAYNQYSALAKPPAWLDELLQTEKSPILAIAGLAAYWLRYFPGNCAPKTLIMRHLIQKIQSQNTAWSVRQKLAAHITTCNDPSVVLLFKQWLNSPLPELRILAILGLGINQETKSINEISAHLEDLSAEVRYAACFALSVINSQDAIKALYMALETGDEPVKMAAAEALALQGASGHEKLKQFYCSEDISIRRVAIFGISQIDEDWVGPFLEKVSIEDSQWVIRTEAGNGIEHHRLPNPFIPKPMVEPWNSGWLIKFAARSGAGVSKQESPVPLLTEVLETGTPEEQHAGLWMMRKFQDLTLINKASLLLQNEHIDLRETASYVLWQVLAAGSLMT